MNYELNKHYGDFNNNKIIIMTRNTVNFRGLSVRFRGLSVRFRGT